MSAFRDLIGRRLGRGSLNGEHTNYAVPVVPRVEAAILGWGHISAMGWGARRRGGLKRGEGGRDGDSEYELVTTWTPPAFTVGHGHMQPQCARPGSGLQRRLRCSVGQRETQKEWRQGGMVL